MIFEIADVKKPILGADFLTVNELVVDLQHRLPFAAAVLRGCRPKDESNTGLCR